MSLADKMNEKKKSDKSFDGYAHVIVSTLNQMVNYIPLKRFRIKEAINITIEDSDYADNSKWDENLKAVYKDVVIDNIGFKQSEITDITIIRNRLTEKLKGKEKIFWNITGGQRPFILAITQFIQNRQDDVICYLEGNKSQMVLLKNNHEIEDMQDYALEDLTIETALKLMGFEFKNTKTSHRNLLASHDESEKEFYLKFLKKYIADKDLRKNCILLNRDTEKENAKKAIKQKLKDLKYEKLDEELENNKAFGYILEKLAGYKILEIAKNKIADMSFGEKINFSEDKVDESHIDEFDIALLTKNGKFMIFECKSGVMDGDVAKSTKYSTYAVSGAYGLPILITPLLTSEIGSIDSLGDEYKYIKSAVKSAKRASLEVWGVDEIESKLEKYGIKK